MDQARGPKSGQGGRKDRKNNEWDSWWPIEADPIGLKSELEKVVSLDFDKGSNDKYDHTYFLPVLSGPHQDRPWVKSLKRLVSID